MKAPSLPDYLIGNAFVLIALVVATGWTGLVAFSSGEWLLPVILLVFTGYSTRASERISAYRHWKRQWDSYGEQKPRTSWSKALGATIVGMALFVLLFSFGKAMDSESGRSVFVLLLLIALFGGSAWSMRRWVRNARHKGIAGRTAPDMIVRQCLGKPSSQRDILSRAYAQLPSYCRALIDRAGR